MTESRWTNVYPDDGGRRVATLMFGSRADADAAAGATPRLYVIRYDLDDEGDRDTITREAV